MDSDPQRKVDELASDLDDLATTVEELQIDPGLAQDSAALQDLQEALEKASSAADVLDERLSDRDDDPTRDT